MTVLSQAGRRRFLTGAGAALLVVVLGLLLLGSHLDRGYRPGPGDDRPPRDPGYQLALQQGLAGDLNGGRQRMLRIADEQPGPNTAAWALYQAGLGARATGDASGAEALFARLRREYSDHPLAQRVQPDPPAAPPRIARKRPDCGPLSLLVLCRQAGIRATLPEIVRRCKMNRNGVTFGSLAGAARQKGFRVAAAQVDGWFLRRHRPSGIAWLQGDHYIAFRPGAQPEQLCVTDPSVPGEQVVSADDLARQASGIVLLVAWGERTLPRLEPARGPS